MSEPRVEPGDLLSVAQVREFLPVAKATVYALVDRGELPAYRVGATSRRRGRIFIHRADLAAYVERARHGATVAPVVPDVDAIHRRVRRDLTRSPRCSEERT